MRRLICWPLAMLPLLFSSSLFAASPYDSFLLDIYRLERCGFMTTSETAKADRVDRCRVILDDANAEIDGINDDDPARQSAIVAAWQTLSAVHDEALAEPSMFRTPHTSDDLRSGRRAIVALLQDDLPKPPSPVALAIQMERIANEYVWRAESVMGMTAGSSEILDIEVMVAEADSQFSMLLKSRPKDHEVRGVYAKYQFIRNSLINYNSNTVPYIVDLYADKITEALSAMKES
jgi:hypothetical protein